MPIFSLECYFIPPTYSTRQLCKRQALHPVPVAHRCTPYILHIHIPRHNSEFKKLYTADNPTVAFTYIRITCPAQPLSTMYIRASTYIIYTVISLLLLLFPASVFHKSKESSVILQFVRRDFFVISRNEKRVSPMTQIAIC